MEVSKQDLIFMIILGLDKQTLLQVDYWQIIRNNWIRGAEVCEVINEYYTHRNLLDGSISLLNFILSNYDFDDNDEEEKLVISQLTYLENLKEESLAC